MTNPRLTVDPNRARLGTGIFVRAWTAEGRCVTACISELDRASLLAWLRRDDGDNPLAEDVVGILLGHGHLHIRSEPA